MLSFSRGDTLAGNTCRVTRVSGTLIPFFQFVAGPFHSSGKLRLALHLKGRNHPFPSCCGVLVLEYERIGSSGSPESFQCAQKSVSVVTKASKLLATNRRRFLFDRSIPSSDDVWIAWGRSHRLPPACLRLTSFSLFYQSCSLRFFP
jgi:hypothetical protein